MLIVSKKILSEVLSNSLHNIECAPVLIIFLRWKYCNMLKAPMRLKCGVTKDVNTVFYCSENKCILVVQMMKESGGVKACLKFRFWNMKIFRCPQDICRPSAFLFFSLWLHDRFFHCEVN